MAVMAATAGRAGMAAAVTMQRLQQWWQEHAMTGRAATTAMAAVTVAMAATAVTPAMTATHPCTRFNTRYGKKLKIDTFS